MPGGILKGSEREAFHLHCSTRQLQRILNQFEQQGKVVKMGKSAYRLKGKDGEWLPDLSKPHPHEYCLHGCVASERLNALFCHH